MAEREEEKVTPPGTQLFSELVEDESVSGVRERRGRRGSEKGSKQREEEEEGEGRGGSGFLRESDAAGRRIKISVNKR